MRKNAYSVLFQASHNLHGANETLLLSDGLKGTFSLFARLDSAQIVYYKRSHGYNLRTQPH
jgi:hypothetical protein